MNRIPRQTMNAIEDQRRLGRTDRQIEKILGLSSGTLARPYRIDDSVELQIAALRKADAEWARRDDRFRAALAIPQRPEGWRPRGNCVSDRPDAGRHFKPRRST